MGGRELDQHVLQVDPVDEDQLRQAAVNVAGHLAAPYPELTATELAADPVIAVDLLELLDAIGYPSKEQQ